MSSTAPITVMSVMAVNPDASPFTTTRPSRGPWSAHLTSFASGAVYLEDADGEIIGWATDRAGHTLEEVPPDRRTRAEILRNAQIMALSRCMLDTLRWVVAYAPRGGDAGDPFVRALRDAQSILDIVAVAGATADITVPQ